MKSWYKNWDVISPIFKFSADVRKVIYTTNAIESLNSGYRRLNKQRSVFSSDTALLKALYLATHEITKKWMMPLRTGAEFLASWRSCTPTDWAEPAQSVCFHSATLNSSRLTVGETWQITVFIVYCKKIERLFFKPPHNIVFYHCCWIYRNFFAEPKTLLFVLFHDGK